MQLKDLSKLVDEYHAAREARLKLDREAEKLAELERGFKDAIIAHMEEQKVSTVGGTSCTVKLKITPKPTVKNWQEVYEYVKSNDAFDVLYKRVNEKAISERQEQGEEVPGLEWFLVATLSVSKGS